MQWQVTKQSNNFPKVECTLRDTQRDLVEAAKVNDENNVNSKQNNYVKNNEILSRWEKSHRVVINQHRKKKKIQSKNDRHKGCSNNLELCNKEARHAIVLASNSEVEARKECNDVLLPVTLEESTIKRTNLTRESVIPQSKEMILLPREINVQDDWPIKSKIAAWPLPKLAHLQKWEKKGEIQYHLRSANLLPLCTSRSPLALQLEAYIRRECRLYTLEHPSCSQADLLHIFREVFAVFVEHFAEYRGVLHLIRDAYEAAIEETAKHARELKLGDAHDKDSKSLHSFELMHLKEELNATISNQQAQLQAAQSLVNSLREQLAVMEHKNSVLQHDLQKCSADRANCDEQVKLLARAMTEESARGANMRERLQSQGKEMELVNVRNKVLVETLKDLKKCIHDEVMSERKIHSTTTEEVELNNLLKTKKEKTTKIANISTVTFTTPRSGVVTANDKNHLFTSHSAVELEKEEQTVALEECNRRKLPKEEYEMRVAAIMNSENTLNIKDQNGSFSNAYVISLLQKIDQLEMLLNKSSKTENEQTQNYEAAEENKEIIQVIETINNECTSDTEEKLATRKELEQTLEKKLITSNNTDNLQHLGVTETVRFVENVKQSQPAINRVVKDNTYPIITEWLRLEGIGEKELIETDYLVPPGKWANEPGVFLHLCEPVANYHYCLEQIIKLLDKFWSWRERQLSLASVTDGFIQWLNMESGSTKTALAIGYNIIHGCKLNYIEPECRAFLAILRGFLPEKLVFTWRQNIEKFRQTCESSLLLKEHCIPYNTFFYVLREIFPEKSRAEYEQLRFCAYWEQRQKNKHLCNINETVINVQEILSESTYFVRLLKLQSLRQVEELTLLVVEKIRSVADLKRNTISVKNVKAILQECDPYASYDNHLSLLAECCQKSISDISIADNSATVTLSTLLTRLRTCVLLRRTAPDDDLKEPYEIDTFFSPLRNNNNNKSHSSHNNNKDEESYYGPSLNR